MPQDSQYNAPFIDLIDNINVTAKDYGFFNGEYWASAARQAGEISDKQCRQYVGAVRLRNSYGHGHAKEIFVSQDTYQLAKNFECDIKKSKVRSKESDGVKVTGKKQTSTPSFTASKQQPKTESLAECKKRLTTIIEKRIDGLDAEFKNACIPNELRPRIKSSAEYYLKEVGEAKSSADADNRFKEYEKKFTNDIRQHPIVKKDRNKKQQKQSTPKKPKKGVYGIGVNPEIESYVGQKFSEAISIANLKNAAKNDERFATAKGALMQYAKNSMLPQDIWRILSAAEISMAGMSEEELYETYVEYLLATLPQHEVDSLINQLKSAKRSTPTATTLQSAPYSARQAASNAVAAPVPTSVPKRTSFQWWQWLVIGASLTVVVIGAILLAVFASRIEWDQWQCIIGSIAGFVLFSGGVWLFVRLNKGGAFDKYTIWEWTSVGAFCVANTVLLIAFQSQYRSISLFIYFYTLVGSAIILIRYLREKKTYGYDKLKLTFQIIFVVLNAIALIVVPVLIKTGIL